MDFFFFCIPKKNHSNDLFGYEEEKQNPEKKKTFLRYLKLVPSKLGTWLGVFLKEDLYQYLFSWVMFWLHDLGIFCDYSSSDIFQL